MFKRHWDSHSRTPSFDEDLLLGLDLDAIQEERQHKRPKPEHEPKLQSVHVRDTLNARQSASIFLERPSRFENLPVDVLLEVRDVWQEHMEANELVSTFRPSLGSTHPPSCNLRVLQSRSEGFSSHAPPAQRGAQS
jgi:hypothetical protein